MSRRICLFTAHSPLIGGGSANFRSLIENLPGISVDWNYLAPKKASGYEDGYLGLGFMGGRIDDDIWQTWQMLSGKRLPAIDSIVNHLLETDCDAYWIVSHNEGIRIALELVKRQHNRPVHLTINDDWAGAICARSMRYRFMAGLAKRMTIDVLKKVTSFDVTSKGMQDYYKRLSGRIGEISHRYIPSDAIRKLSKPLESNSKQLKVGHIGSVYDKNDFFEFIRLVKQISHQIGLEPEINMWGWHIVPAEIPNELRDHIKLHATLPESEIIPQLAECSFVYSMYPMNRRMRIFSQTSMPTKLSSYVQAGRPIFGHGPADSSLAEFLQTTGTGVLWSTTKAQDGMDMLAKLMELDVSLEHWEFARKRYYGEENVAAMRRIFENN
ncbi:glycosyltransferase family protein [Spirosoma validum]|uniref:Glycosyltransferase family 4 protein n=1 Tax=Spirosoma validum TaxID=2771355 RepID=A0A927GD86_9BACT|nr:hypothetical protein [Spirosoma validum]MBD2753310.1 hypothetical protein [Spirosoma validum]